ncbi:MAG: hypothetical protein K2W97_05600 [Chthoniobacterales bacterium]|nr:hypothetical protein [Chthoniobacterales bacterium]
MNQSPEIAPDYKPNRIGLGKLEPSPTRMAPSLRASGGGLEFRDVTGEDPNDSFLYSILKNFFRSAYKFFSYVSYYLTSCFTQDSFRDVTSDKIASAHENIVSDSIDGVVERAAVAIVEERKENQRIIYEYDLHYSEHFEFYQQQEDFLKNYLEYLRDAFNHLRTEVQKFDHLKKPEPLKSPSTKTSVIIGCPVFDLIDEINATLESLKEIPELTPQVTKTWELLFLNKKRGDTIIQFSAKALATMIKGQLDYFKRQQGSSQVLKKEADILIYDHLELLVAFDPQSNRVTKTEFAGRKIEAERLPKSEELPEIKKTAEHARLSLLNYMGVLRKEIAEEVTALNQEISHFENIRKARATEEIRKQNQAYKKSSFRWKI